MVFSLQQVKESNLATVLNLIISNDQISRAEIVGQTDLSPATVSSLVQELIDSNLVIELGRFAQMSSGRRPIMLKVNPDGGYCFSIELLHDGFLLALYDITCKPVWEQKFFDDYANISGSIIRAMETVPGRKTLKERLCLGISVGYPGLYNAETSEMLSTVLPVSGSFDLFERLETWNGKLPVIRCNSSSFFAYAEHQFGMGKNVSDMVSIDVNVGVGAGIIIDGRIFTGSQGFGSELGHMTIDMNGPKCKCGSNGCFEVMCNTVSICRNVTKALNQNRLSMLRNPYNKTGTVDLQMIQEGLENSDPLVVSILRASAKIFAHAVNNVCNLLNPEMVVIGGDITILGPRFLEMIRKQLATIRMAPGEDKITLVFSEMNKVSVLLGGAKYLIDSVLSGSDIYSTIIGTKGK